MAKVGLIAVEKTAFHFDKLFEYLIPKSLDEDIKIGSRVLVPFGSSNSLRQGMVLKIKDDSSKIELKEINSIFSNTQEITDDILKLISYLHSSCFCTWHEAIKTVLPLGLAYKVENEFKWTEDCKSNCSKDLKEVVELINNEPSLDKKEKIFLSIKKELQDELLNCGYAEFSSKVKRNIGDKSVTMVKISNNDVDETKLSLKQKKVYEFLKENTAATIKEVSYFCGITKAVIDNMIVKGIISKYKKEILRTPTEFIKEKKNIDDIKLNDEQNRVFLEIEKLRKKGEFNISLLKGVTGSGKTIIFIKLIDRVLKEGKQVIVLVPEISLTPQLVDFFNSYFGEQIALLHSGLSMGERLDEYKRINRKIANIVIGTRSAIFAPLDNIGLIIMDEEGESSYKSSDMSPRYHARDIAKYRCKKSNASLVLASATPSIETQYNAKIGKYHLFELKERYKGQSLPEVIIINKSEHPSSLIDGVSLPLAEEIARNFERKEQSILLLNRRGYHSSLFCIDCGYVKTCDNCSASMTYHKANNSMVCHYCGNIDDVVKKCPVCGGENIVYSGRGTQKIEEDLKSNFPSAKILRMDADTTFSRADLEEQIKGFEEGSHDILIGTQIVAKGLNFPNVTLVGVLLADSLLYGADFRCRENLFSLLTQVVGRSGRGNLKGRAVIQTYRPDNETIMQAAKQDYDSFYDNEIKERKAFFCPPFCDLCSIGFSGKDEIKTEIAAKEFLKFCKEEGSEEVPIIALGISSPYVYKLSGRFRKRIILKCIANHKFKQWILSVVKKALREKAFSNIRVTIDINGEIN